MEIYQEKSEQECSRTPLSQLTFKASCVPSTVLKALHELISLDPPKSNKLGFQMRARRLAEVKSLAGFELRPSF